MFFQFFHISKLLACEEIKFILTIFLVRKNEINVFEFFTLQKVEFMFLRISQLQKN